MDPDLQADDRRRAQRRRVEVHPLQRAPARPHGRRPPRPDGLGRGGRAAAADACATSTASTTSRTLADEIIERSEAATRAVDPRAAGRHLPRRSAVLDLADGSRDRHRRARSPSTPTPARSRSTTRARPGASPYGINVVKNYTHAYTTFTVRSRAEPRDPQQPRQPGADQGRGAGGLASSTRCRPQPCTARHVVGHVPAQRAAEGAGPDQARAGDGRGLRRGVDDAGQRQPRRRPPVHHGDVHLRRRRRRPGDQARARRPARTRPAWPPCRSRWSRRRRPIRFLRKELRPGSRRRRRGSAAGSARRSSSRSTPTRPWQLNAVTSRLGGGAAGHLRRGGRAPPGRFTGQRRAGTHAGAGHAAARTTSCASSCPAAAGTAQPRWRAWGDVSCLCTATETAVGAASTTDVGGDRHDRAHAGAARTRSTRPIATVEDARHAAAGRLHRRRSSSPSSGEALFDREWLCVGRAEPHPERRRLLHRHAPTASR